MNPLTKAINMILRGNDSGFKSILNEALADRAALILETIYKQNSKDILKQLQELQINSSLNTENSVLNEFKVPSSFTTKDGKHISLTPEQTEKISKLYENLNNSSKERLIKLLTESEEAVNRILNLSKIERKSNVN